MDMAWLERQALHYLGRWEATAQGVRRVLERRIQSRCARTGESAEEALGLIEALLEKLARLDYVDDARFAANLVRSMRRQGKSHAQIRARMREKGVSISVVDELVGDPDAEHELAAAWATARKRRIGPYTRDPESRAELRNKQLAILARRGFSFDIARRVIEASEIPEMP